jgi:hypothetical protein
MAMTYCTNCSSSVVVSTGTAPLFVDKTVLVKCARKVVLGMSYRVAAPFTKIPRSCARRAPCNWALVQLPFFRSWELCLPFCPPWTHAAAGPTEAGAWSLAQRRSCGGWASRLPQRRACVVFHRALGLGTGSRCQPAHVTIGLKAPQPATLT